MPKPRAAASRNREAKGVDEERRHPRWEDAETEREVFRMCLAPPVVNGRPPLATIMKLPRYNTTWESAASRRELKGAAHPQEERRPQQQPSTMTRTSSSGVRRSHSATPRRQQFVQHYERRSHSTEPSPSSMRSEELPIPRVGGRRTSSSVHNVDANELVKMYDFAVSSRRSCRPWLVMTSPASDESRDDADVDSLSDGSTASIFVSRFIVSSPCEDVEHV